MNNLNFNTSSAKCEKLVRHGGRFIMATMCTAAVMTSASCKKKETPPPPPPIVEVLELKAKDMPITSEFIGQLDSPQNVEVRARVEAFVDKVLFQEGTEVKEGDPLFLLDKKPLQQRLSAAEGLLEESKAALNKYEKDVARLQPLAEKRAIPQQDLDNAVASVAVGEASVLAAEARVEAAKIDLGYCEVNAPSSGMIGAKQVSVGSLVGKGEPTLMATISQLDPIWFYCNVGEASFLKAESTLRRTGQKLEDLVLSLILADGSVHTEKGKFVFIDRAVDSKTGTLRVRAEFANPAKSLRPGMFARIIVQVGTQANSVIVPERAVAELQGKNFVWVINGENNASQRAVQLGETIGVDVIVTEGLKAGERVVVEGLQKVSEGGPVKAMTAEEIAAAATAQAATAHAPEKKE